jgi:hypothetical protein
MIREFQYENMNFIDTSGLKTERRKWKVYLGDVYSQIFIISLAEYDDEEFGWNLKSIQGLTSREDTTIILFSNLDLFEQKIKSLPFSRFFKDFNGNENDPKECISYLEILVKEGVHYPYMHYVNFLDLQNICHVLKAIKDIFTRYTCMTFTIF